MTAARLRCAIALVAVAAPGVWATGAASNGAAQAAPPRAARPAFTVASIKPTPRTTEGQGGPYFMPGGRFRASGVTLALLMRVAYSYGRSGPLLPNELAGGPAWIDTDRFDLDAAVADSGTSDPLALLRLQSLLEERFRLRIREETREGPVYDLVLANTGLVTGPQLKRSTDACPPPGGAPPAASQRCGLDVAMGRMSGRGVELSYLALVLSGTGPIERRVRDRTGLRGQFDLDLVWSAEPLSGRTDANDAAAARSDGGPSIFTAIEERLGLRLQPARGPIDVIVIEGAERPTEN